MNARLATGVAAIAALAAAVPAHADRFYATTNLGTLISFDSADPRIILSGSTIEGLAPNEVIRGIDFRPSTWRLYGLGSFGNLYTLDTETGRASKVATLNVPLSGSAFGMDFDPVADRLRVTSDLAQNLNIDPDTGQVIVEGTLNFPPGTPWAAVMPHALHIAYSNNRPGAGPATLFAFITGTSSSFGQIDPTTGTITIIRAAGSYSANFGAPGGFDVSGATGIAYAARNSSLFQVDIGIGPVNYFSSEIGNGLAVTSLAIIPAPATLALLALGGLLTTPRRRR